MSWGSAPPFSLGVEEELFLVDAETLGDRAVLRAGGAGAGRAAEARALRLLRRDDDDRSAGTPTRCSPSCSGSEARSRGERTASRANAIAAGTHPLARGEEQPLVPLPRYERLREELGERLYTQLVCGLHVHVALPDADTACARSRASCRGCRCCSRSPPTRRTRKGGPPGCAPRAPSGCSRCRPAALRRCFPTGPRGRRRRPGDDTRRHWDAWPRPEHGTLEVRVIDQQTDVRRSAGFAALVQALVAAVADAEPEPYDRELYAKRRAEAARLPPDPAEVAALAELIAAAGSPNTSSRGAPRPSASSSSGRKQRSVS